MFFSPLACNVLVQDTAAVFKMSNFGHARNCTLSALFPAAISLGNLRIGSKSVRAQEKVNYDVSMATREREREPLLLYFIVPPA